MVNAFYSLIRIPTISTKSKAVTVFIKGPQRIKGVYAWRSLLDTGVHLTLNSDFPGESLNPFFGLTRAEVLKAYTVEADLCQRAIKV